MGTELLANVSGQKGPLQCQFEADRNDIAGGHSRKEKEDIAQNTGEKDDEINADAAAQSESENGKPSESLESDFSAKRKHAKDLTSI